MCGSGEERRMILGCVSGMRHDGVLVRMRRMSDVSKVIDAYPMWMLVMMVVMVC